MLKAFRNKISNMHIKIKIILVFFVFILSLVTFSFVIYISLYKFLNEFNTQQDLYYRITQLRGSLEENFSYFEEYVRHGEEEQLKNFLNTNKELERDILILERQINNVSTYMLLRALSITFESYLEFSQSTIEGMDQLPRSGYIENYSTVIKIEKYMIQYVNQLLNIALKEGGRNYEGLINEYIGLNQILEITIVFMGFILLALAVIFSTHFTKSIEQLALQSTEISGGNFDVMPLKSGSKDEIGVLIENFNKMTINLKQKVENIEKQKLVERRLYEEELKNIKMEKLLKEAQYMMLKSQINPHFLYNTINIISRTALFENAEETLNLLENFSDLLRYSISTEGENTLSKELRIVEHYMSLQKQRFGKRIQYKCECGPEHENVLIPNFIIQTIVENSFIHGIEPRINGGSIKVKITEKNEIIKIAVIDNGQGIEKSKLYRIGKESTGIGMSNVFERMSLYFDSSFSYKVKSKPNKGTIVEMRFSKRIDEYD